LLHPKYRPDIDGLRAIAVLSVVAFHAFPGWVKGGFIGVDIFFVISGFLISTIIFENVDKGTFSFTEFYTRRIRRIFPALLLVLAACLAFGWFALFADEYKQLGKHIAAGAGFISNFVLWGEAGYFDNSAETKPLLHLWSLGIEEQFYIIWPPLLWLARKRKFHLILIIGVVSFYLNLKGIKQDAIATFYSPLTRFWELLAGSLLAWVSLYKKEFKPSPNLFSIAGLLLLAYGFLCINKDSGFPGLWATIPVLGAMLLISAGPNSWINRELLSNRLAVWFGLISFPLYLWHWPLLSFARIIESEMPHKAIRLAAVLLSIALAWLTYRFLEKPIRRTKKVMALVVLMGLVGGTGYLIFSHDGYGSRASIKDFKNNKNELVRTPYTDEACFKYINNKTPLFPLCRFTDANSTETIAVIGDSHAYAAYPGIAEYVKAKGKNTVLLANSGCPPYLGAPTRKNDAEKEACKLRMEELIHVVLAHKDIQKIFFFTRGPIYVTGVEPLPTIDPTEHHILSQADIDLGIQRTINSLTQAGKKVFYVTENPELSYTAPSCITRPFRLNARDCRPEKAQVMARQKDYLNALTQLQHVTIINSTKAFCPENKCIVFEDGSLLYSDDDHLSVAGSRFQVKHLLAPFLQ
jgi:peptidoglycan/LPS O-acetylase OafA/YrhL